MQAWLHDLSSTSAATDWAPVDSLVYQASGKLTVDWRPTGPDRRSKVLMVLFSCSVNIARPSTGWLGRLQSHECDSLGIQEQFAHDVPEALVDLISLESWQESVHHFNREVGRAIRTAKRAWFLPSRSPDDVALKTAVHLQRFLRANSYHTRFSRKASRPLAWLCSYVSANSTDAHYCTSAGVVLTVSDHNYGNIESLTLRKPL